MSTNFRLITLAILLFIQPFIFGQSSKIKEISEIQEIELVLDSVFEAYRNVEYLKSYNLSRKALELSEKAEYQEGMLKSYIYLAQNYASIGKYNESQISLSEADELNKKLKNKFIQFEIQRIRGRNFGDLRLYEKSIQEFKKNLNLVDDLDKNDEEKEYLRSMTYENLFVTYESLNKWDSSYYYMDLSKRSLEKISPQLAYISKSTLNTYLGRFFTKRDMVDSANFYFKNARLINQKYNYPYNSFNDESWADLLLKNNQPNEALEKYLSAIQGYEQFKSHTFLPNLYNIVSDIYLELGKIEESKSYKNKAFDLKEKLNLEKLKAIGTELNKVEIEKEKSSGILKIVQYTLLGVLICFALFLIYYLCQIRKRRVLNKKNGINSQIENSKMEIFTEDKNKSEFEEVIILAKENSPEFFAKFQDIYPNFVSSLLEIQPTLHLSELTFSAFLYLNFSTKEIAQFTSTSPRTVQTRKYNLRKKLDIPSEEDIYIWMRKIKA